MKLGDQIPEKKTSSTENYDLQVAFILSRNT